MFDWYILNLPRRKDRRVLSIANAIRLDVPVERIHFHPAQDNEAYADADAILQAIIEDGFTAFAGHTPNYKNLGINCHIWNVCRFLRELADTKNTVRMLCHDGIIFTTAGLTFCPDYHWYWRVTDRLQRLSQERDTTFKFLQIGHVDFARGTVPPIEPGSLIVDGINSYDNFARIYSTHGAQIVLQRILENPTKYMEGGPNNILKENYFDFTAKDKYWQPPGAFSTALTFVRDMPNTWLGSDTVNIPIIRDKFADLFEKDQNLQQL